MAATDLPTTHGTGYGANFSLNAGSTLTQAWNGDNDNVCLERQCNSGSGRTNAFAITNFTAAAYPNISSVQILYRMRRTGTTDNAKQRFEVDRTGGGDWWYGTLLTPVNTFYTNTVTAPSGGWSVARLNALIVKVYHDAGSNTASTYLRTDYMRIRVNWDYFVPNTIVTSHSNLATDSVDLDGSYNANGDGATEYRLQVKEDGGSWDTPSWTAGSGTGSITATQRNVTGLTPGTLHYYRLAARNEGDVEYYSSEGSFTTLVSNTRVIVFF
jgi:hypothetical protein